MAAGTGSSSSSSSQFDLFFCVTRDASRCIVYSSCCAPGEVTKELKHLGDYSSDYDVLAAILSLAQSALARVSRIHARLTHSSLPSRARRLPSRARRHCAHSLSSRPRSVSTFRFHRPRVLPPSLCVLAGSLRIDEQGDVARHQQRRLEMGVRRRAKRPEEGIHAVGPSLAMREGRDRPRESKQIDEVITYDDDDTIERGYRRSGGGAPASAGVDATWHVNYHRGLWRVPSRAIQDERAKMYVDATG